MMFPHTLTNNGNVTYSVTLTTVERACDYTFDDVTIYADANGDGVPDDISASITATPEEA